MEARTAILVVSGFDGTRIVEHLREGHVKESKHSLAVILAACCDSLEHAK